MTKKDKDGDETFGVNGNFKKKYQGQFANPEVGNAARAKAAETNRARAKARRVAQEEARQLSMLADSEVQRQIIDKLVQEYLLNDCLKSLDTLVKMGVMKWPEEKIVEKPEPELDADGAKAELFKLIKGGKEDG